MSKKCLGVLKNVLSVIFISLNGLIGVVFAVLYLETFGEGFVSDYFDVILTVTVVLITVFTMLAIIFLRRSDGLLYKLFLITVVTTAVVSVLLYALKASGFLEKIDSVEDLRSFVSSFGGNAVIVFIALQFLQVVVLPIPAFITVAAGVLIFGAFKGAIFSCIGIIVGSFVAFFIGRVFGYRVAKWLVGRESLDKWLNKIKGKDKIVLTFMFLFPFFPDDVLCFVAGITTMSALFFSVMIVFARLISVFATCYSLNNSIIPYDTWWGILLWVLFIALTIILTVLIYKKGNKIEKLFSRKKKSSKSKQKTNDV